MNIYYNYLINYFNTEIKNNFFQLKKTVYVNYAN